MTKILFKIFICLLFIFIITIAIFKGQDIYNKLEDYVHKHIVEEINIPDNISEYKKNTTFITVKNVEEFTPNNRIDLVNIFYTIINNGWDTFSFYCPNTYETCVDDVNNLVQDGETMSLINNYVSPFNTYINFNTIISNNKEIYITISRLYTKNDIDDINDEIDRVFGNIDFNNTSDKDKVKILHDYLINTVTYDDNYIEGDYSSPSYKANGALIYKKCVCSGYTDALSIMLDRFNIPNFRITSESHVWNAIYIDNKWYHVDVTWDDDENNKYNRNNFFMINTEELFKLDTTNDHLFNKKEYLELY